MSSPITTALRSRRILVLLAITVIALIAAVVGQLWLAGERSEDDRVAAVSEAADRAVAAELSYDYRRLEAGAAEVEELLTGDAKAQFIEVHAQIAKTATDLESVVTAEVKSLTVLDHDEDSARVLLFVDQTSSSKKLTQPQLDQSRVLVTMTRSGSAWLVSELSTI